MKIFSQLFRRLFGARLNSLDQAPVAGAAPTLAREAFETQMTQWMSKMPASFHETFQDSISSVGNAPLTDSQLIDALATMHRGLGVAIGRGSTGEDQRYETLGQIVDWLYEELGRPQDTEYAVVKRVAIEWQEREVQQGKA